MQRGLTRYTVNDVGTIGRRISLYDRSKICGPDLFRINETERLTTIFLAKTRVMRHCVELARLEWSKIRVMPSGSVERQVTGHITCFTG
jgi:hypothetical protein